MVIVDQITTNTPYGGYRTAVDLTIVEAWNLWWSGNQLTDHTLYGVSILWLSRAGKLLTFLAGVTIVLDAIGPERLRAYADRVKHTGRHRSQMWREFPVTTRLLYVGIIASSVLSLTSALLIVLYDGEPVWLFFAWWGIAGIVLFLFDFLSITGRAAQAAAWVLEHDRLDRTVRAIAVPLFLTGFVLDVLAA